MTALDIPGQLLPGWCAATRGAAARRTALHVACRVVAGGVAAAHTGGGVEMGAIAVGVATQRAAREPGVCMVTVKGGSLTLCSRQAPLTY